VTNIGAMVSFILENDKYRGNVSFIIESDKYRAM
jgi:hypothetical protein